ncbi:MAG TPA: hypothetical protein VFZ29_11050 [Solirubrobacterales bacterium]
MKYLKMLGLAAVAAMAFTAFAASSASATTLEVNGVTTNATVTITASAEESITLSRTDGTFANTCTESHVHGHTTLTTGHVVTGPLTGHNDGNPPSNGLSFSNCERPVTVHRPGTLEITHIAGTTDGTVFSKQAEVTTGSPFGTLNCKTGETTHIGTLTGTDGTPSTFATMDIKAVLNCGFLVPSANWKGAYTITTPHKLGVSA